MRFEIVNKVQYKFYMYMCVCVCSRYASSTTAAYILLQFEFLALISTTKALSNANSQRTYSEIASTKLEYIF